jgi:2-polyprenyl-3-methyl-5-hydroxy-6-metoxy-1,4-benzoquinol methylase
MSEYVLGHHLKGEGSRLALMSELLDPMHRRYIEALGIIKPGARTLEVGCGNGSISAWLAQQVSPGGKAVAVDLDLSLIEVRAPNLELRQDNIVAGPVERGSFDLVTARAVLHHIADAEAAIAQTITELRGDLITSGKLNDALMDTFLDHCADSRWWTETIAFSAMRGRAPDR